jgi:hypothetical protein
VAHAQELQGIIQAAPPEGIAVRIPVGEPTHEWDSEIQGFPAIEWEATIQGKVRPLQLWPGFLAPCQ